MAFGDRQARMRRRGRRRSRGGRRRGLYLLPQLFTTANLFFGFFAMVEASVGRFDRAAFGIVLAVILDGLDGRIARLAHSTSRFGQEYDSLADVVSFGVAPALLAYYAGDLALLGRPGWVLACLFTVCVALRLARFNVSASRYAGRFEGLPSPMAAGMVAATQWFMSLLRGQGVTIYLPEAVVAAGLMLLSLLMVSAVPYRSFKEIDLRHSFRTLVVVVLVLTVIVLEPTISLFTIGLLYASSGPVEWVWRRAARRPLIRDEATAFPSEPDPGPEAMG